MALPRAVKIIIFVVASFFVGMIALALGLVFYLTPSDPEPDAILDLGAPGASVTVPVPAGAALTFRTTVKLASHLGNTKASKRKVSDSLRASQLEIRATDARGGEIVRSCKLSTGMGSLVSIGDDFRAVRMHNDCGFRPVTPGPFVIRATATWQGLAPLSATLVINTGGDAP